MVNEHPEIRRAHQLLASSDALLERVRNRPAVEINWPDPEQRERRTVHAPARKVTEFARTTRTMDSQTQKTWDVWAKGIAQQVAQERTEALAEIVGEVLAKRFAEQAERITGLERRINQAEQQIEGKVTALHTGTSG